MRITGGMLKGRQVVTPGARRTRPTLAVVRKALFDILGDRVPGAVFWDVYAGSGAVGIEALSRGASRAVFVEESPVCCRIIKENLERMGLYGSARIVKGDAFRAFKKLGGRGEVADIIFLDPPYSWRAEDVLIKTADAVAASGLGKPGSVVVFQHSRKEALPGHHGCLTLRRRVEYGDTVVSFYDVTVPAGTKGSGDAGGRPES